MQLGLRRSFGLRSFWWRCSLDGAASGGGTVGASSPTEPEGVVDLATRQPERTLPRGQRMNHRRVPCLRAVHLVQTWTTAGATVVITIAPPPVSMVSKDQLLLLDRQSRRPNQPTSTRFISSCSKTWYNETEAGAVFWPTRVIFRLSDGMMALI